MSSDVLSIQGLSVHIGERALLRDIDLSCGQQGFYVVMGPVGVGKSTLLSVLEARVHEDVHVTAGQVFYNGQPLGTGNHPAIVRQASREEQKAAPRSAATVMRLIDEALHDNPAALCLDEPTASLAHQEVLPILHRLKEESKRRAIVMVTHNSEHARLVGDWMTVIGGGQVIESGAVAEVFAAPQNAATKQFLRTGSMSLPRPDAHARSLAPEFRGMPQIGKDLAAEAVEEGLIWIIRRGFALLRLDSDPAQSARDVVTRIKEYKFTVALLFGAQDAALREALAGTGVEIVTTPVFARQRAAAVQACLICASEIETRVTHGQHVIAIAQDTDPEPVCVAASLLISRGLTATDAIELMNSKICDPGLSVEEEQFLWDVELALDIQSAQVAS